MTLVNCTVQQVPPLGPSRLREPDIIVWDISNVLKTGQGWQFDTRAIVDGYTRIGKAYIVNHDIDPANGDYYVVPFHGRGMIVKSEAFPVEDHTNANK